MTLIVNNNNRIKKVKRLLGLIEDKNNAVDDETHYYRIADVLCDLHHYCDKHKINYDNEIRMASTFYENEIKT